MWQSKGLRIAVAGLGVFFVGAIALLFSKIAGVVLMLGGGVAVWSGFIWTLVGYYLSPRPPEELQGPGSKRIGNGWHEGGR